MSAAETKPAPAPDERAERERMAYALVVALALGEIPVQALRQRARAWMRKFGAKEAEA